MDLCEGSLAERRVRATLARKEVRQLAGEMARALEALHAAGLVHRDITPANILRDGDRWLLSGLGVAQTGEATLTVPGAPIGSPDHWSPEALGSQSLGPAADICSLGCVLYHCLSGRPPYVEERPPVSGRTLAP